MMIHEITAQVGRYKQRKRIGRGTSSGHGRTSGRGHKGCKSRSGYKRRPGYEGGQMPLFRRLPKRGFSNARFRNDYHIVNLKTIEAHCDDGADVTPERLVELGVIRDTSLPVKVLGEGEITRKLKITAARFSASARAKIEAAGGTATVAARQKWSRNAGRPGRKADRAKAEEQDS